MAEKASAIQASAQTTPAKTTLKLVEPQAQIERMNRLYDSIARRAFEIFEGDGGVFGRDLRHWFEAETEFLHPAHVSISETGDTLAVEAEVPGFSANELEVSLEPRRLTISGKRESSGEQNKKKTVYSERCSNEILRVIDLPMDIDASKTTATLKNGILELKMPKATETNRNTRVAVQAA